MIDDRLRELSIDLRRSPVLAALAGRTMRASCILDAVVVRHARQIFLKLAAGFRWREDYLLMRRRLEALT